MNKNDSNKSTSASERMKKYRKNNKSINIIYTVDQYKSLCDICEKNQINGKPYPVRKWIKERSLDKKIRVKQHIVEHKVDREYILQLSRVGNLLNQITRGVNSLEDQIDKNIAELYMQEVIKCLSEINRVMEFNEFK